MREYRRLLVCVHCGQLNSVNVYRGAKSWFKGYRCVNCKQENTVDYPSPDNPYNRWVFYGIILVIVIGVVVLLIATLRRWL